MEEVKISISTATVKAKVVNVSGSSYPTLRVLVKKFSYTGYKGNKFVKKDVVFNDYIHKIAFFVSDRPSHKDDSGFCDAIKKVGTLAHGDIIEFTIHNDVNFYYFTSFEIIERNQECLEGINGLAYLIEQNVPQIKDYYQREKVIKKQGMQKCRRMSL